MLFALCLFFTHELSAALGKNYAGGASAGTAGIRTVHSDIFSAYNNQAGLAFEENAGIGIHAERRFMVEGLDRMQGVFALPTSSGTFGLSLSYYGNPNYQERKAGISYARLLTEQFSIGVQFNYIGLSIAEYGQRNTFTFELGFQYFLYDNLLFGAHIYNPLRIQLEDFQEEQVPTVIAFGLRYEPLDGVHFLAETEKDINQPFRFRVALDYGIAEAFSVRAGFMTAPASPTLGIGFNWNNLHIDVASFYHPVMGFSPHLSLSYHFGSKSDSE